MSVSESDYESFGVRGSLTMTECEWVSLSVSDFERGWVYFGGTKVSSEIRKADIS